MHKRIKNFVLISVLMIVGILGYAKVAKTLVPSLKEGTFLPGQTLSVWPSWSVLGSEAGKSFPVDPINMLGLSGTCTADAGKFCTTDSNCAGLTPTTTCTLHDPETGWSTADRRFSFACSPQSYAYRYIKISTSSYEVRSKFENPFSADSSIENYISNWDPFVNSFVSTTKFIIEGQYGICKQDQEISTAQNGVCGDGKLNLNKGEKCDPPGKIQYGGCGEIQANKVRVETCDSSCKWNASSPEFISCFGKCGNGKIETGAGEICDDGVLNGTYNHCNTDCNGKSLLGYCGDGDLQDAYEICDPGTGQEKYSLTSQDDTCGWNCQSKGPYCGDKIIQSQYGEECDGNVACTIGGEAGEKQCTSSCKKSTAGNMAAWWKFDTLSPSGSGASDSSGNGNNATCSIMNCPEMTSGKNGLGLMFNNMKYLSVPNSPTFPTEAITISAWIKPISNANTRQIVIQKVKDSKGFAIQHNFSANKLRFSLYNVGPGENFLLSDKEILTNSWTHIAATYKKNGDDNVMKLYINGELEKEKTVSSAVALFAANTGAMNISKVWTPGSPPGSTNAFSGMMDEIKLYSRALTADEIKNEYNLEWPCSVVASIPDPITTAPSGNCGNGVIDASEACDKGADNGQPCVPGYGAPCTYCSTDCQNSVDVQPTQYCGNGVIEASEKCENAGGSIYTAFANAISTESEKNVAINGYREKLCTQENLGISKVGKGNKDCVSCDIVRNCVTCGVDSTTGMQVAGKILNVLQTKHGGVDDPLMVQGTNKRSLKLFLKNYFNYATCWSENEGIWKDNCSNNSYLASSTKSDATPSGQLSNYILQAGNPATNAKIVGNPICSFGPEPNYSMVINADYNHAFDFPVLNDPPAGQYDLVISPIIKKNGSNPRPNDLRVVVSWQSTDEFIGGFIMPDAENPVVEGPSYTKCPNAPGSSCIPYPTIGKNYYNYLTETESVDGGLQTITRRIGGAWYHGLVSSGKSAESFTFDTSAMDNNAYAFYVKTPYVPISPFRNIGKLKVEIYLPETDQTEQRIAGAPVKTIYLDTETVGSDNPEASYWHVFDIIKPMTGSDLAATSIMEVNRIISGASEIYVGSCTGRPAGTPCRKAGSPGTASCDQAEYCDGSDFCPPNTFKSAGNVCRPATAFSYGCDVAETCTGLSANCPTNSYTSVGTTCTIPAMGFFDVEKTGSCDGGGNCNDCPAGLVKCGGVCTLNKTNTSCEPASGGPGDGNLCTINDKWQDDCGTVCAGTPKACADPFDYTADSCNPATGACTYTYLSCDDGNVCTSNDKRIAGGGCEGATISGCCVEDADCPDPDPTDPVSYCIKKVCESNVCGFDDKIPPPAGCL